MFVNIDKDLNNTYLHKSLMNCIPCIPPCPVRN